MAHVASLLNNQTLGEQPFDFNSNHLHAPDYAVRVNTYWFLSLILSLITVLVGIVSLQWLREFQRYPRNLSSRKILAMRTMRSEAFHDWFVPEIFAGLPLLLQLALILFFVGLADFLLHLGYYLVAIPVITAIGSTFIFLFLTTTLPCLQSFWLINKPERSSVPSECPYKSPQSWAFLRFCSSWPVRLALACAGSFLFSMAIVTVSPIFFLLRKWGRHYYLWKLVDRLRFPLQLKFLRTFHNWDLLDEFWLDERQRIATRSLLPVGHLPKVSGNADYDAARGLSHIINNDAREESMAIAVYHCFQELPLDVCQDDIFDLMIEGLPGWVKAQRASRMSPSLRSPSNTMIRCENEVFLLARMPQTANSRTIHIFRKRQLEVFVRILSYIFTDEPWEQHPQIEHKVTSDDTSKRTSPGRMLIPTCLKSAKGFASLPEPLRTGKCSSLSESEIFILTRYTSDLKEQLLIIYESFVQNSLSDTCSDDLSKLGLCYKEEVLGDFMQVIQAMTLSLVSSNTKDREHNARLLSKLISVINLLTQQLLRVQPQRSQIESLEQNEAPSQTTPNGLETPHPTTKVLTFHISILYLSRFDYTAWAHILHREPDFARAFKSLVSAAHTYEQNVSGRAKFALHHMHYYKQWRQLVREVLRETIPSISPDTSGSHSQQGLERDTVVDPPPGDCYIDIQHSAPSDVTEITKPTPLAISIHLPQQRAL